MSSIIKNGDTFHGISVESRGVFKDEYGTRTYAGQCKDGCACGLGVATYSDGTKIYAEHGPDGQCDGGNLIRWAFGDTYYYLYERGRVKASARVSAEGRCIYDSMYCAPDDPRMLALIAQVAPVEVRPAVAAPPAIARHSPPNNRPGQLARFVTGALEDYGHRGASPAQSAARRPWLPCGTTQWHLSCTTRPEGDA